MTEKKDFRDPKKKETEKLVHKLYLHKSKVDPTDTI